jgi:hypothetical protein
VNIVQQKLGRAIASAMRLGTRKLTVRVCGCGREFVGVGRSRKVARRLADEHIQQCREKARAAARAREAVQHG